jgi:anti-sigma factor ChrR (cupin superfamily)
MFEISGASFNALHQHGLRRLRLRVLQHWQADLPAAWMQAGEAVGAQVLNDMEAASLQRPELTEGELMALADLMLVSAGSAAAAQLHRDPRSSP